MTYNIHLLEKRLVSSFKLMKTLQPMIHHNTMPKNTKNKLQHETRVPRRRNKAQKEKTTRNWSTQT